MIEVIFQRIHLQSVLILKGLPGDLSEAINCIVAGKDDMESVPTPAQNAIHEFLQAVPQDKVCSIQCK